MPDLDWYTNVFPERTDREDLKIFSPAYAASRARSSSSQSLQLGTMTVNDLQVRAAVCGTGSLLWFTIAALTFLLLFIFLRKLIRQGMMTAQTRLSRCSGRTSR